MHWIFGLHILYQLCQQNKHSVFCIIRKKENINLFSKFPNIIEKCRFIISDIDTPEKYMHVLQNAICYSYSISSYIEKN